MEFSSGITTTHRRKQRRLQILSILHHLLNTATQHTTICNLLASPPKLTWHTHLLHHPFKSSNQKHHTIQPYNLTCSSHRSHLYTQLPSLYVLTFPCIKKYIIIVLGKYTSQISHRIVFIADLSRTNTGIRKYLWCVICWFWGAATQSSWAHFLTVYFFLDRIYELIPIILTLRRHCLFFEFLHRPQQTPWAAATLHGHAGKGARRRSRIRVPELQVTATSRGMSSR
jgi:hypothetical protein